MQKVAKLRHMSVAEVGARLGNMARVKADRRRYYGRSGIGARNHDRPQDGGLSPRHDFGPWIAGLQSPMTTVAESWPLFFEALRSCGASNAERIVRGKWMMLGHEFDLRRKVDWHRDPRSSHRFPRAFYADVPTRQDVDDGVDVKYVWEIGRHQYLAELVRGWLFSHEQRFAARARELLLDWIEENPLYEGVHWISGLEVAMRTISWIWAMATSVTWAGWKQADVLRIGVSLAEHAEYLAAHFSFYSSPYNHLVGEATALYLASLALDGHPRAAKWRSRAREVLNEHGPRQFYHDGFSVEQATGYHFYTLGFLTMAIVAARRRGEPFSELEPHVHRAYRAGAALRPPNGRWPALGDVDAARSIPVFHEDFWQFDSLCHVAAVLFEDAALKVGREPGFELYWLLGSKGLKAWHALTEAPKQRRVHLPDAGYAVATEGNHWLLFDAGPIADGLFSDSTPSTAHGHLDMFQVLYHAAGKRVLVDGGMPYYFQNRERVQHFRGPAAHNTIEIEGLLPAREAGTLGWSNIREQPALATDLREDAWLAWAQVRWEKSIAIERHVLCVPQSGLWIADWIQLDRVRAIRWRWHLAPESVQEVCGGEQSGKVPKENGLRCIMSLSQAEKPGPRQVSPEYLDTWIAPTYGVMQASCMLQFEARSASVLMLTGLQSMHVHATASRDNFVVTSRPRQSTIDSQSYRSGKLAWQLHVRSARRLDRFIPRPKTETSQ